MKSDLVEVGILGKSVGLKGFVKLHDKSDFPKQFKKDAKFIDKDGNELVVKSFNSANSSILFYDFEDIDLAKTLTNRTIYTTQELTRQTCNLKKDEFFYFDILGCKIYENDQNLGVVEDIEDGSANHLFCIKTDDELVQKGLAKNFYIPYINAYVEKIDIQNKIIYTKNAFLILENS
ncbi:ribosome maturation factor RimM [Campylobacter sp. CCUG 57310]|uniref:ribosome maturation factor RimM n=1 Tax=Campylobacter sp. CCUG 57310 TaxID=2517362 RepID=UPI001563B7AE|nr:ribosome maturation factor RimM [Campylobacter sp. CCUG 57310]QKF91877.1 16S rRNA processing protein [Campylobacter sp. CCUG 57310]